MTTIKYLSICSGIESVGVAWNLLGFECLGLSEIDPFRSAVLNYRYPEVKNHGDFTKIEKEDLSSRPDILVGGTPCATFSVARYRKGIKSSRGNLALEFILLAERLNPTWILWENVPGVLSSNEGKDFGSFLGGLAEFGYGFSYRVLDTQHIRTQRFPRAIPQRRRRVFVVGHSGADWKNPAKVLFDKISLREADKPVRRKSLQNTCQLERELKESDRMYWKKINRKGEFVTESEKNEVSNTLTATGRFSMPQGPIILKDEGPCENQNYSDDVERNDCLRILTPVECERLQGFPDNYTQIPYKGKPKEECPVSKRYEACGRAMSINVMEWLGTRIQKVHQGEI